MKSQLVTLPGKKYYVPLYAVTWLKDSSRYQDLYAQHVHEEIEQTFMAEEETSRLGYLSPHGPGGLHYSEVRQDRL